MKHHSWMVALGSLAFVAGLALISRSTSIAYAAPAARPHDVDGLAGRCDTIRLSDLPAQCGSQASSCKNCHEVKGEDPVNTQGDWHISHAFGDFCEYCHGGNVQAVEKDGAHQGLVAPLGDVKINCAACHDDFETRAQAYATALGVTVAASNSGSTQPPSGPSSQPTPAAAPDSGSDAPSGGQIVDYTTQYATGSVTPISTGNIVVGILLALAVAGGGAFIYWNEKRMRKADPPSPIAAAKPAVTVGETIDERLESGSQLSPDLQKLLPTLQSLDSRTLRAIKIILSDRRRGEEMLQSLSLINFAVLEEMKRLDKKELSLLLALAAES